MKMIIAYVQPYKLEPVTRALERIEHFPGMTVVRAEGFGREKVEEPPRSKAEELTDFTETARIEIVAHDVQVNTIIQTITRTAHTGQRGDGKIFVLPVERAARIKTMEEGEVAV
jgi:nitrogen regulatory protein PII